MSPRTLDEIIGQRHILDKDKLLYRAIKADRLSSIILWGPPGCGKTALAKVIANTTQKTFKKLNAVTAGVSDIKSIISDTQNLLLNPSGKVVLFIDEIHRFNKLQQDALLPFVEDGTIILIGATTENPYFEVNKALISRSTVFKLNSLEQDDICTILKNALNDKERGLGNYNINISDDVINFFAKFSTGDVRAGLNAIELAVITTPVDKDGFINITEEVANECIQDKRVYFDKDGDSHYDNISAMIKSMRGSSPDGALFYLARAISCGEDPVFLARRIVICASEDVGMANPQALVVAQAAAQSVQFIGMPEARIILAEAAVYVATSPKSNASYMGINNALEDISTKDIGEIPYHLRNAVTHELSDFGYGKDYKYAHNYENNYVEQQYLPDKIKDTIYYNPTNNGYEIQIKEYFDKLKNRK
jgi:putative ATPase